VTRRALLVPAALSLLAALSTFPPAAASAAPGDLVLTKSPAQAGVPRTVSGAFGGVAAAPALPRPANFDALIKRRATGFPHEIAAPGWEPSRAISSAGRRKTDLFSKMKERALKRAALGADAPPELASFPGEDTVRIALLRVDFRVDRGGAASTGDGRFELQPRDTVNRPLDPTPHNRAFFQGHAEALRRYYHDQMGGRVVLEYTVYPTQPDSAYHLSDMADYGPWKFSTEIYRDAVKLFRDCLVAADTTDAIPWGTFDRVTIIHAGSDLQSDVNADSPEDIPTFTIGVADTDAVALGPTKADTVFSAIIAPESIRQDGYEGTVNAVYAHESGHSIFGWRDVYDVRSGLPTVGYWSLMDVGNLVGNAVTLPSGTAVYATGILPPAVDPWQKRLVYDDMPSAPEPAYGSQVTLGDIEENFTVYKVPLSGEEYLLLENRLDDINQNGSLQITRDPVSGVILGPSAADTLEWDFLVPGPGILAWHVDESVANFFGPRADPDFGLNVNRNRFGLQIIEADGLDDLGDFNSPFALGATTDPWSLATHDHLGENTVPKLLTNSETHPHLDLHFTSVPGPSMTLRVDRLWDLPGWPVVVHQPPGGISPVVAPLGTDPQVRIAWAAGDSAVHARNADGSPMVPGAPDDVIFRASGPLGHVAVVPRETQSGGPFLAVAEDGAQGGSGKLYLSRVAPNGAIGAVETVPQPASVTAGPATGYRPPWNPLVPIDKTLPPPVYTGLANGNVVRTSFTGPPGAETATTEVVRTLTGAVTGVVALGENYVAASDGGDLADASRHLHGVLTAGHAWQPIAYGKDPEPDPEHPTICIDNCVGVHYALVDLTVGALASLDLEDLDATRASFGENRPLGEPVNAPALDDVDGDGLPEIVFTTRSGRVGWWNENGSFSPGWPPKLEREGFPTFAGPLPISRTNAPEAIVASLGNGVLTAVDAATHKPIAGFPLGLSVGARGTGAIDNSRVLVDGPPVLFVADGDTLLRGIALLSQGTQGTASVANWSHEGGTAGRAYAIDRVFRVTPIINEGGGKIFAGSFKCYPNPARQSPVTFAFRLTDPERVTIRIFDAAAREVDAITRDANSSDNAITWDPGSRPSGLYLARVQAGSQVLTQPFVLVR
jgi:M6 family metalloprotease-like protein